MIRDNEKYFARMQLLLDVITIVLSYVLAWNIQFKLIAPKIIGRFSMQTYMMALIIFIPMLVVLYSMFKLYESERIRGRRSEAGRVFSANMLAVLIFIAGMYMMHITDVSRRMLVMFTLVNIFLTVLEVFVYLNKFTNAQNQVIRRSLSKSKSNHCQLIRILERFDIKYTAVYRKLNWFIVLIKKAVADTYRCSSVFLDCCKNSA